MTIREAQQYCLEKLQPIYQEGEAHAIMELVLENLTGSRHTERRLKGRIELNPDKESQLKTIISRLRVHEPVQYVLNESWFGGLKFYVDRNVLIPRPETEELVEWIISNCKFPISKLKILDIGTGSGCIPIVLKRKLRKAEVWSCDQSEEALEVARRNARELGVDVNFLRIDFLDEKQRDRLPVFDLIVSNPPYIPEKDKARMPKNVLEYEPYPALFVPGDDALVFYHAIAEFGKQHLQVTGSIFLEIHEDMGETVTALFHKKGYTSELKKDMQGKDRMIKVMR